MKKYIFKTLILVFLAAITFAAVSACGGKVLPTPQNAEIDVETFRLSWDAVAEARSYEVRIIDNSGNLYRLDEPRKSSCSLEDLDVGDYEIAVRAVNATTDAHSEWTPVIYFRKDYDSGCVYTLINNDTEFEVTKAGKGLATKGDVTIEDNYRGRPVTRIADAAFRGKTGNLSGVTGVKIGENVAYIGDGAFNGCTMLEWVTMPDGVTYLGEGAFNRCLALESVTIPKGVTEISSSLFINCSALTEVVLHDGVTRIGDSAFFKCSALKSFDIPDSITEVGENAFADSGLESVTIGDGVSTLLNSVFERCSALKAVAFSDAGNLKSIGRYAFSECTALTAVTLPDGLESIESSAFYGTEALTEISIPASVDHIGSGAFTSAKFFADQVAGGATYVYADNWLVYATQSVKDSIEKIDNATGLKDEVTGIADSVFRNCKKLKEVVLPAKLKFIGKYAFADCQYLWKFNTTNVEEIDEYAFSQCVQLYNLLLGRGLKKIGSYAFAYCAAVSNLDEASGNSIIPDSVESIGTYAFYNTDLWLHPDEYGVVYAGNWVVGYNYNVAGVRPSAETELKENVRGIGNYAFYNNEVITNLRGLNRVRFVGKGAFYGCSKLSVVSLNRNLKKIEDFTFYKCMSLFFVTFPPYLESVGRSAFYKCTALNTVDLSVSEIVSIEPYAFYECTNLVEASFGEYLESIGEYAFYKCSSLAKENDGTLVLPDSLKNVGGRAFAGISTINNIEFGSSLVSIGEYAFSGLENLKEINLPDSVKTVGGNAFYNCTAVERIDLGGGVEDIGKYAFFGMKNVRKLIIPSSVKSIGAYAFKGYEALASVFIPSTVETIYGNAFYGGNRLTVYTDAQSVNGGWQARWNSSYRPVVWGAETDEGGTFVYLVTITESGVTNANAKGGLNAPIRTGYDFVGWSIAENSATAEYGMEDLIILPAGTKIYAVWKYNN